LLRNATALLDFGGQHFLVDPMLDDQGARPAIPNTPHPLPNPLVPLPDSWREIVAEASAHIVTHLHQDHFDSTAASTLVHSLPMICQPADVGRLEEAGFHRVEPVETFIDHHGVKITRTDGQHGSGEIGQMLAPVSGFVFEHADEPVTYLAGDTIWCEEVAAAIERFRPAVIVVDAGGARFLTGDPIVMTAEDIASVAAAAPDARIVVVHLEAINHCLETRDYYRTRLPELGVDMNRIHIPNDGEALSFS
jgi:L-ascorbate metabolism protein UlaG (beta-lactamase superfamily)